MRRQIPPTEKPCGTPQARLCPWLGQDLHWVGALASLELFPLGCPLRTTEAESTGTGQRACTQGLMSDSESQHPRAHCLAPRRGSERGQRGARGDPEEQLPQGRAVGGKKGRPLEEGPRASQGLSKRESETHRTHSAMHSGGRAAAMEGPERLGP